MKIDEQAYNLFSKKQVIRSVVEATVLATMFTIISNGIVSSQFFGNMAVYILLSFMLIFLMMFLWRTHELLTRIPEEISDNGLEIEMVFKGAKKQGKKRVSIALKEARFTLAKKPLLSNGRILIINSPTYNDFGSKTSTETYIIPSKLFSPSEWHNLVERLKAK